MIVIPKNKQFVAPNKKGGKLETTALVLALSAAVSDARRTD